MSLQEHVLANVTSGSMTVFLFLVQPFQDEKFHKCFSKFATWHYLVSCVSQGDKCHRFGRREGAFGQLHHTLPHACFPNAPAIHAVMSSSSMFSLTFYFFCIAARLLKKFLIWVFFFFGFPFAWLECMLYFISTSHTGLFPHLCEVHLWGSR